MQKTGRLSSIFLVILILMSGAFSANTGQPGGVPEWAREAVWYQIFPERFYNGDASNDPTLDDMEGPWPYFRPDEWQTHPWTSDWYKLQPWELKYGVDFHTAHGKRRYGGDLQGVLEKLDYLQALGINAIYFNPLFESASHHKYDATMYHHIDNNFGPDPEGDREIWAKENPADPATWQWTAADSLFLRLLKECHRRGIRVILDGVFNHVGTRFWAFQDVLKNQQDSPYKDWFVIERLDDPATPQNEFKYTGWAGVKDLPELREDENGLVPPVRQHVFDVVKRWMDPNGDGDPSDGVDGWRLDVAEKVNIKFWREFRKHVKSLNPEAYIVGEVWWEDWPRNKMFNAAPWLQGDAFDAVMNYRFARAVKKWAIDRKSAIGSSAFSDSVLAYLNDYGLDHTLVCQNLMDSHDVDRLASQIVNCDRWFDHGANPMQNHEYNPRKPTPDERRRQKVVIGLQFTLPGAPMIYYGDEAGMWGGDDPSCRKPMVWPEFRYETEKSHPLGYPRQPDSVYFDGELFQWYQKMVAIRKQYKVLSHGGFFPISETGNKDLAAFTRAQGEDWVLVVANRSDQKMEAEFILPELPAENSWLVDEITGERLKAGRKLRLTVKPYAVMILIPEDKK